MVTGNAFFYQQEEPSGFVLIEPIEYNGRLFYPEIAIVT